MDAETLTLLLRGVHLNMPERIRRKAWPHPPLRMSDLVRHLVALIENEPRFPDDSMGVVQGHGLVEGVFIERRGPARFACVSRRTFPGFEESERIFENAEDAARFYLKWALNLPGDLDGWTVVE